MVGHCPFKSKEIPGNKVGTTVHGMPRNGVEHLEVPTAASLLILLKRGTPALGTISFKS